MTTATVSRQDGKYFISLDERISREAFGAFRSLGFLWHRSAEAFGFADNAEGAKRIRRLFNGKLADGYGLTEETREELRGISFEYEDDETREHVARVLAQVDAQRRAEEEEKERKARQAAENNAADREKLYKQLADLPNGWTAARVYDFMCPIMNTREFFERGGLVKEFTIPEVCDALGIETPDLCDASDVLTLKIRYDYKNRLAVSAEVARADGRGALVYRSGNFSASVILSDVESRRSIAQMKAAAAELGDDLTRGIIKLYQFYIAANGSKAVNASVFDRVPGNGSITIEELRKIAAA